MNGLITKKEIQKNDQILYQDKANKKESAGKGAAYVDTEYDPFHEL